MGYFKIFQSSNVILRPDYHSYELETLAVVEIEVTFYWAYFSRSKLKVNTDCNALSMAVYGNTVVCIARWWLHLADYDFYV